MKAVRYLFASAVLALSAGPALAHGDAKWIMDDPNSRSCCGPKDCTLQPDGAVVQKGDGYTVVSTGEHIQDGSPNLYPSIDEHYWICRQYGKDGPGTGLIRCLFVPRMGS